MLHFLITIFMLATIYWSIRGLVQIFQRHNSIAVICYIVFLFPIAYLHMFFLGAFGNSKAKREEAEVQREAEKQTRVQSAMKKMDAK